MNNNELRIQTINNAITILENRAKHEKRATQKYKDYTDLITTLKKERTELLSCI